MRASVQRLLVLGILALWTVPTAGALAVGLHLALDHHGHHQTGHGHDPATISPATGRDHPHDAAPGHDHDLAALARAASHGHRHAEAVPDHDHEALLDAAAPFPVRAPAPVALLIAGAALDALPAARSDPRWAPWRGPPPLLFRTHCSLLL